jgi:hypothetical protein
VFRAVFVSSRYLPKMTEFLRMVEGSFLHLST